MGGIIYITYDSMKIIFIWCLKPSTIPALSGVLGI